MDRRPLQTDPPADENVSTMTTDSNECLIKDAVPPAGTEPDGKGEDNASTPDKGEDSAEAPADEDKPATSGSNDEDKDKRPKEKIDWSMPSWAKKTIGMLMAIAALLTMVLVSSSGATDIPTNEGFALMETNKVETAKVIDSNEVVILNLKSDYTTKSDKKNVGKIVSFGWSIGQRDKLAKILDKASYKNGYTVVYSSDNIVTSLFKSVFPIIIMVLLLMWLMKSTGGTMMPGFGDGASPEEKKAIPDVTFKDVAGEDMALIELKEVRDQLANPRKYLEAGAHLPKGVLLYGPPGTGKTLLAKALAGEIGADFYYTSASSFVQMFVGLGASRVRDLFKAARKSGKAVIFIDELDAIGGARGKGPGGDSEREQTLNQLLTEMDGFKSSGEIIVLGATNRPDYLDAALLRPGRFDRQISVDIPDLKGREDILHVHARNKKFAPNVDFHWIAQQTAGFSGAQLEAVLNEAAFMSVRSDHDVITFDDVSEGIDRVMAGPRKTTREDWKLTLRHTAIHEAGHAVAAMAEPLADNPTKITILPRGKALGYTMINSEEDQTNLTKAQIDAQLTYMMGGRASEEEFFDSPSTGASNDIEKAYGLVRKAITDWGFSDTMGYGIWSNEKADGTVQNISEQSLRAIESEVSNKLGAAHERARVAVHINHDIIEEMVDRLLEKETLGPDDINEIRSRVRQLDSTVDIDDELVKLKDWKPDDK